MVTMLEAIRIEPTRSMGLRPTLSMINFGVSVSYREYQEEG